MLTALGCPGTLTRQSINSCAEESLNRGIPQLTLTIPVGSAQGALNQGIPRLRNLLIEEFLGL